VTVPKLRERANVHDHLCLIYRDQREELAAAISFIKTGLEMNDQCIYVADDNSKHEVLAAMKKAGVQADEAVRRGQLIVCSKHESYLNQGQFDPAYAIDFFKDAAARARANGYRALRGSGEMSWQLSGDPGSDRLIEYEANVNHLFRGHSILALCQYNMERFSPADIRNALYTHPKVIIGRRICKNPYYKPPREFLHHEQPGTDVRQMIGYIYGEAVS